MDSKAEQEKGLMKGFWKEMKLSDRRAEPRDASSWCMDLYSNAHRIRRDRSGAPGIVRIQLAPDVQSLHFLPKLAVHLVNRRMMHHFISTPNKS